VKSARIGFTFASMVEAVLDCLQRVTTWTVLSASKEQGKEAVGDAGRIIEAMGAAAQLYEEPFADELGESSIQLTRLQLPNGSRIIVLPANPRTARGYPGNAILDEFAHHDQSYSIWAAISRQVLLQGHKLRILSTPNGEQGKFFELAREFGLVDGVPPAPNPVQRKNWSWHWIDVRMAIAQGCPISLEDAMDLYKGDPETAQQELFCAFLKAVGSWLSLELLATAEDSGATLDWPAGYKPVGPLFLGVDVARDGDRTVAWLDEHIGDVAWTRMVLPIHDVPFFGKNGKLGQAELLEPWVRLASRTAMDCTGIGLGLFEYLDMKCPGRVMGINFAGLSDKGVKIKTDLAVRTKKRYEQAKNRIPYDLDIRQELLAIKRENTASGVKFDAPRIEIEGPTAGGRKKKVYAHADSFWAQALAHFAAESAPISTDFLASGRGLATQLGPDFGGGSSAYLASQGF